MKSKSLWLVVVVSGFFVVSAPATIRYVAPNSATPLPPYTSWATAATNIQPAVEAALSGDVVLVTNGIYQTGTRTIAGVNRVAVDSKTVTILSVNGPAVTVIKGSWDPATNGPAAVRCVYLASGSVLSGFTLTNGATAASGTTFGGGVYCQSVSAVVSNCIITGNGAASDGGGGYSGTYLNCKISGNASFNNGGGINGGAVKNCVITGNSAKTGGGTYGNLPENCTIAGNVAAVEGGGVDGASTGAMNNCIVYGNTAPSGSNNIFIKMNNCCTVPVIGSANNFTNAPIFVDPATGNFHLQPWSPCINAGNNSLVTDSADLDGNPRIAGGTVDMGAYEFQSTVRFVNVSNPAPVSPFTNWAMAATNIQDAIDAANAGDFILVSNGVYKTGGRAAYGVATNRVTVDKAVTVQSVNGAAATIIAGAGNRGTPGIRGVYLTNGAALIGFTLTNGTTRFSGDVVNEQSGGGVWCETGGVIVSNCVFTGNYANQNGGGAFRGTLFNCLLTNNIGNRGAGACSNSLFNCVLTKNFALFQNLDSGGGAIYSSLSNCLLVANSCDGGGGGAAFSSLTSCVVSNNTGNTAGGGVCMGIANDCLISSNRTFNSGGGAYSNLLNNCVLKNNLANGNGGGAYNSALDNCTVISNKAAFAPGAVAGGGIYGGVATNSILYYNSADNGSNFYFPGNMTINYCCTTPLPTNGVGNVTNEPAFANLATGDFHLQSSSPCINAGNNAAVTSSSDFAGNPRIVGATVDMGAYEFQSPGSLLSYAWAQQYGLPTDGTADNADSDGDGMSNWQEWQAGTIPIDATSVLKMVSPSNSISGTAVTWQSVSGKTYFIQRSGDLSAPSPFSTIQSNIAGQAGTTTYNDTTASGPGPFFYRVGVQ